MSLTMVGGDKWVADTLLVTTAANLAAKSLITAAGAAVANAANGVYGVIAKDTPSGDDAEVKIPPSIVEVICTGTVTAGTMVEVLQGTVYANIDGTSVATTSAGVSTISSGYPIGMALTTSEVYGTAVIALFPNQAKTA